MRIAFISYEYPPDTASGGIATYTHQAAVMMARRGHVVEVFAASKLRKGVFFEDGVTVHLSQPENRDTFADLAGVQFAARHAAAPFDVMEGPDYRADARTAAALAPEVPLIVRLHTPRYLVERINMTIARGSIGRRRVVWEAWRRGVRPLWDTRHPANRVERCHALDADEIIAPSDSIARIVARDWRIDPSRILKLPNPFVPSPALLSVPVRTRTNTVAFIGRLESRKGVLDFARAIPLILAQQPKTSKTKFRFVGMPLGSPNTNQKMDVYIQELLAGSLRAVDFTGHVPFDQISGVLCETDICVFPSIWENFPNVCLEAMSAGRGIVGSWSGGMQEMLDGGRVGRLVPPRRPDKIAAAILDLLADTEERERLGESARARVLSEYSLDRIGAAQEASFVRVAGTKSRRTPRFYSKQSPLSLPVASSLRPYA